MRKISEHLIWKNFGWFAVHNILVAVDFKHIGLKLHQAIFEHFGHDRGLLPKLTFKSQDGSKFEFTERVKARFFDVKVIYCKVLKSRFDSCFFEILSAILYF